MAFFDINMYFNNGWLMNNELSLFSNWNFGGFQNYASLDMSFFQTAQNQFNPWFSATPIFFNSTSAVGDSYTSTTKAETPSNITSDTYTEQGVSVLQQRWSRVASEKKGFNHDFYKEVVDFAKQLKIDPDDIMTIFYSESSLRPDIPSGIFGCIGSTRRLYHVDGQNGNPSLQNMSPLEQFRVYKKMTLESYKMIFGNNPPSKLSTGVFYAINGNPMKLKKLVQQYGANGITDKLSIIDGKAYSNYPVNQALDYNKKGYVSIGDLETRIKKKKAEALRIC